MKKFTRQKNGVLQIEIINSSGKKEMLELGGFQDLKIDLDITEKDVFSGDGFFPMDTTGVNKSIKALATNLEIYLDAITILHESLESAQRDSSSIKIKTFDNKMHLLLYPVKVIYKRPYNHNDKILKNMEIELYTCTIENVFLMDKQKNIAIAPEVRLRILGQSNVCRIKFYS